MLKVRTVSTHGSLPRPWPETRDFPSQAMRDQECIRQPEEVKAEQLCFSPGSPVATPPICRDWLWVLSTSLNSRPYTNGKIAVFRQSSNLFDSNFTAIMLRNMVKFCANMTCNQDRRNSSRVLTMPGEVKKLWWTWRNEAGEQIVASKTVSTCTYCLYNSIYVQIELIKQHLKGWKKIA